MPDPMPDADLAAILARVRAEYQFSSNPCDMQLIALCDAVERLTIDKNAHLIAEAERDRRRQLLTDRLAKCPTCGGSGREVFASRADCPPKLCSTCGPIRAAMEVSQ